MQRPAHQRGWQLLRPIRRRIWSPFWHWRYGSRTCGGGGFGRGLRGARWGAASPDGLTGGGRVIGLLERGLIFAMILLGQPEGVGLLIAAKSILRFGAVK